MERASSPLRDEEEDEGEKVEEEKAEENADFADGTLNNGEVREEEEEEGVVAFLFRSRSVADVVIEVAVDLVSGDRRVGLVLEHPPWEDLLFSSE